MPSHFSPVQTGRLLSGAAQSDLTLVTAVRKGQIRRCPAGRHLRHSDHVARCRPANGIIRLGVGILRSRHRHGSVHRSLVLRDRRYTGRAFTNHARRTRTHRTLHRCQHLAGETYPAIRSSAAVAAVLVVVGAALRQHVGSVLPDHGRTEIHERGARLQFVGGRISGQPSVFGAHDVWICVRVSGRRVAGARMDECDRYSQGVLFVL